MDSFRRRGDGHLPLTDSPDSVKTEMESVVSERIAGVREKGADTRTEETRPGSDNDGNQADKKTVLHHGGSVFRANQLHS